MGDPWRLGSLSLIAAKKKKKVEFSGNCEICKISTLAGSLHPRSKRKKEEKVPERDGRAEEWSRSGQEEGKRRRDGVQP